MAICNGMNCTHKDKATGKCLFSGTCLLQQQTNVNAKSVMLIKDDVIDVPVPARPQNDVAVAEGAVFNPFQRGNGCMLAGYSYNDIFGHNR